MKIAGKRVQKGNVLLFISFAAVSLCLLIIVSSSRAEWENKLSKNDMYTGHQQWFSINGAETETQWEKTIRKLVDVHDNFSINVTVPAQEIAVRGICIQGKVNNPPMIEGEYFDYSTSWTDSPKAVVGKEFQKDVVTKNGKTYYSLEGLEYEVIGIMGTSRESRINHMVVIDFRTAIRQTGINTQYELDTSREDDIKKVGHDMDKFFPNPGSLLIVFGEEQKVPFVSKFLSSAVIMQTMYVLILISFCLSTVLVTFIWLRFRRRLLFSWKLCGYDVKWEWMGIFKKYFIVAAAGFIIGFMMMLVLAAKIPDIYMTAMDVILALGITTGLGGLILAFSYGKYRKKMMR